IEGRPQAENDLAPQVDVRYASPDFFSTLSLPLIKGRSFTETDRDRAPLVAIINQSMAHHYWGNENPLGKRISLHGRQRRLAPELDGRWLEIGGVVGDVTQYGLEQDQIDAVYVTMDQGGFRQWSYLLARTAAEPTSVTGQLRTAVHEIDPETVVDRETTL